MPQSSAVSAETPAGGRGAGGPFLPLFFPPLLRTIGGTLSGGRKKRGKGTVGFHPAFRGFSSAELSFPSPALCRHFAVILFFCLTEAVSARCNRRRSRATEGTAQVPPAAARIREIRRTWAARSWFFPAG